LPWGSTRWIEPSVSRTSLPSASAISRRLNRPRWAGAGGAGRDCSTGRAFARAAGGFAPALAADLDAGFGAGTGSPGAGTGDFGAAVAGPVGFGADCLAGPCFGAAFLATAASAAAFDPAALGADVLGAGAFGFGATAASAAGDRPAAVERAATGFDPAAGSGLDRPAPDETEAERSFEPLPSVATRRPWRAAWSPASASCVWVGAWESCRPWCASSLPWDHET
jgi:hypothetical protein